MSHIGFRSLEDSAEVGGRERHYCNAICHHAADGLLDLRGYLDHYYDRHQELFRVLGVYGEPALRHFLFDIDSKPKSVAGSEWNIWQVQLNTVMVIGSDAMKFCARVHAQCEIHGYVEGPNRAWLADIIDRGLKTRVLRRETQGYGKGWEDVAALLRSRDDGPVVMDYSVTDSWPRCPDPSLYGDDGEGWYDLPAEERWRVAMEWLRGGGSGAGLEMRPDDWDNYFFGDGRTVFDLREAIDRAMNQPAAGTSAGTSPAEARNRR